MDRRGNRLKIGFVTLGCKVNQFESQGMICLLKEKGFLITEPEEADLVVLNTCVVTHRAESESRKLLKKFKRLGKKVLVGGCWPQLFPEEPLLYGADGSFGNKEKVEIVNLCEKALKDERPKEVSDIQHSPFIDFPLSLPEGRTRAFLKIQDGCETNCTFCVVPKVRGRPRSLNLEKVLEALRFYHEMGVKEAVLCGIHLGKWGEDLEPKRSFSELLELLEQSETPPRIRLSSIEPQEFDESLIKTLKVSRKICPHVHLPVQSGSESILKMMGRPYSPLEVSELLFKLKEEIPDVAIGSDFIVGFPGEGEREFMESVDFVLKHPFSYLHVFPFSPRPGTLAADFSNQIPEGEKKKRVEALRRLGLEKKRKFYQTFIGRRLQILAETSFKGLSRNYIRCAFKESIPQGQEFEGLGLEVKDERLLVKPLDIATIR